MKKNKAKQKDWVTIAKGHNKDNSIFRLVYNKVTCGSYILKTVERYVRGRYIPGTQKVLDNCFLEKSYPIFVKKCTKDISIPAKTKEAIENQIKKT